MKKRDILAWFAILLTFSVCMVIVCWSLGPFQPIIKIKDNKLGIKNKVVKAGDNLILEYDVCKTARLSATVTRYLADSRLIYLPSIETNSPTGCYHVETPVLIPADTISDTYIFSSTLTYRINPIKIVDYTFSTDEFQVIGDSQ